MRFEKLKDSSLLKPGELLVVLKNAAFFQLQQSAESGRLQFYRNRQEPVPWINRVKHGRMFRRPKATNERRAHFSNATEEILQSYGVALKLRQKRKWHMLPNAYDDLSLRYQKLERASWNTAKERRQHQPSNPQPSVLGFVKPGAAYRERSTTYKIPSYKEIDRNLIVAFVRDSSAFRHDPGHNRRGVRRGQQIFETIPEGKEWTSQSVWELQATRGRKMPVFHVLGQLVTASREVRIYTDSKPS
jgi:hypothetical protein